LGRASIYADQKKYELAIADYSTVIGLRPRDASALVQRAVTFQRISTTTSSRLAYADLILALQIDPNNPLALFQRGALFEGSDELDFALADYKTLAKVYPTYSRGVGAVERVERKLAARRQKP
jgi:tetratricopeptide (TPR) repeat protein